MNKKIGILGLSLTFMLALASCGNPTTTKDETSSVSSSEKVIDYNPVVKNNIYLWIEHILKIYIIKHSILLPKAICSHH